MTYEYERTMSKKSFRLSKDYYYYYCIKRFCIILLVTKNLWLSKKRKENQLQFSFVTVNTHIVKH